MKHIVSTIQSVLKSPKHLLIFILTTLLIVTLAVSFRNFELLWYALLNEPSKFFPILISLFGSLKTNFTFISAVATVTVSVLFGLNVSMLAYALKNMQSTNGVKRGFGGLVFGAFGIGCASCGAFLLSGVLSLLGAGVLITFLPLKGAEFSLLAIVFLIWSMWSLSKSMTASCNINTIKKK